jgi:F-type H+-transporting ATPase subunit a
MEHHVSWLTQFVNHYLGGLALQLLAVLHIEPNNPEMPIPEHVVMALLVLVIGTILALFVRAKLSVEKPGATQQVAEKLITNSLGIGIRDLLEENVHHHPGQYIPFVGSISVFILLANLLGVVPAFSSPTGNPTVPLACACLTFLYFNFQGLKVLGPVHYAKNFAGPVWWLAPLIWPVEIISMSARLLSLTVRLWANILASDLIYGIFLSLSTSLALLGWEKNPVLGVSLGIFAALFPVLFIALHIFVSIIQAYIFTILPSVYLGMATSEEH